VTTAVKRGVNLLKICDQTGHKNLEMLRVYGRDAKLFVGNAAAGCCRERRSSAVIHKNARPTARARIGDCGKLDQRGAGRRTVASRLTPPGCLPRAPFLAVAAVWPMLEKTPSGESATARSSERRADKTRKESTPGRAWEGTSRERHPKLWAMLPPESAPYACTNLSKAETDALVEALGDGFGAVRSPSYVASPLPREVQSGLIEHSFYIGARSEYDADEGWVCEFWDNDDDDQGPAPYEHFSLGFNLERLHIYFENQFLRFCRKVACEEQACASLDVLENRRRFEERASSRLYEKAWYRFTRFSLWTLWRKPKKR
jgi:hypothetical protein